MLKYKFITETGLKRSGNEDALGVFEVEEGLLAVVCDGLGGNKAGDVASKLTVETIHTAFVSFHQYDYLERIRKAIFEANKKLQDASASSELYKGMATTVDVLYLIDNSAYWGHVGDSRIYHLKNKKLRQITKDHSLVQKLVDEGLLTMKEAENHPNKNIIMRALGDTNIPEVDVSKLKLNTNEEAIFFLCTDGVTNVIRDEHLEKILNGDFEAIIERISTSVEKGGAPDNYSYIIIKKSDN